jgi:hypothetical protein
MAMLVLKNRQRALLAEKVPDTANLAAGAPLFGQFLSERPFFNCVGNLWARAVWVVFFALAVTLAGEQEGR